MTVNFKLPAISGFKKCCLTCASMIATDKAIMCSTRRSILYGVLNAHPLVSQAHVRLRRVAGNMGSNRLAKVTGIQAQLLANDHIHCLGVGFPQAWQSCRLYCLNNLQVRQVLHLRLALQPGTCSCGSRCHEQNETVPRNATKACKAAHATSANIANNPLQSKVMIALSPHISWVPE